MDGILVQVRGKRFAGAGGGCVDSALRALVPLPKAGGRVLVRHRRTDRRGGVGQRIEDLYRQWGYGRARVLERPLIRAVSEQGLGPVGGAASRETCGHE